MSLSTTIRAEHVRVRYRSRGVNLAVKRRSSGDHLLVFLHGLGCAKESFDSAFDSSALDGYSICTVDLPGHGESDRLDPSGYSLEAHAEIIIRMIRKLPFRRLSMICHSMGGAVGLIALQSEIAVDTFVSVEGNLVPQDCGLVSRRTADQSVDCFLAEGFPSFVADLRSSGRPDWLSWANWYLQCDPHAIHASARSLVEWSDSNKLIGLFGGIRSRSYVYGAEDHQLEDYLLPKLRDTAIRRIARAGHFPMLDNASEFYQSVAEVVS